MTTSSPDDQQTPRFDRFRAMLRGLRISGMCVIYQDRDLAVLLVENPPAFWPPRSEIMNIGDRAIFDAATAERVIEAKRRVLARASGERLEVVMNRNGDSHWFEMTVEPDTDGAGRIVGLLVTCVEITEIKHREQVLRTLLREVSHRSKNLLAIIQSIAMQTARHTGTLDDFLVKFRGRIQSLSQSQDLVTESNWRGARFSDLVATQIRRYAGVADTRISVSGPDCSLAPNAALHVGLALHELVVNSTTFGVLAEGGSISLRLEPYAGGMRMIWDERLASPRVEVSNRRFGSAVLEKVVPAALEGAADYRIGDRFVHYALDITRANCVE